MSDYKNEFIGAIVRTRKFRLQLETPVIDTSDSYCNEKNYKELKDLPHWRFPEVKEGKLACNCAHVSYFMKPFVEKIPETESSRSE